MSREEDKLSALLTGLIAGGIIGSLAALLFAPSSGRVLRRKLNRKAGEIFDDVEEYYESSRGRVQELYSEGKKRANGLIDDAKKIVSN